MSPWSSAMMHVALPMGGSDKCKIVTVFVTHYLWVVQAWCDMHVQQDSSKTKNCRVGQEGVVLGYQGMVHARPLHGFFFILVACFRGWMCGTSWPWGLYPGAVLPASPVGEWPV
ncbi:hypothetical protein V8C86DRAFT_2873203, partial [Haematococcus lacustris]